MGKIRNFEFETYLQSTQFGHFKTKYINRQLLLLPIYLLFI